MEKIWHRDVIKYLHKKGLGAKDLHADMVATLGDDAPAISIVQKWVAEFKGGRQSLEDDPRPGRPTTATTQENIDQVHRLVMDDRRLTISQIASGVGISRERVEHILHNELGMSKVSARWVPRLLTPDQKLTRVTMSRDNLALFEADPAKFMERFLTQNECWDHHLEPETKRQSMQWKHPFSPLSKKARVVSAAGKVMASVFWDSKGIFFIDYLKKGQTINGEYYANLLRQLRKAIKTKRPGKLTKGVLLHQDNAPAHTSMVAMAAARDCGFQLVDHPPYSPDLAPSDYFFFPNMKKHLAGHRFTTDDEVIAAVEEFFGDQNQAAFTSGIQKLQHRWDLSVARRGDYVEK